MRTRIFFFILCLAMLTSCRNPGNNGEYPKKLYIGFASGEDPTETLRARELIAQYLKDELGLEKVEYQVSTNYAAVIEAMKTNKLQVAHLGELSYVLAAEKAGAEAIISYATNDSSLLPTGSLIITHVDSKIKNMDDVKRHASELTLCFADPASTSGHMFPRLHLNEIGLPPEASFKQVFFSNGHTPAIFTVMTKKSDLGCTFYSALERLHRKGQIDTANLRILWRSKPYIYPPICVKGSLPAQFKKDLQQALVDLPTKAPQIWKDYKEEAFLFFSEEEREKIIMVAVHDSLYNTIRNAADEMRKLDLLK
jgi:phosphonate transport system substrate-binding protein